MVCGIKLFECGMERKKGLGEWSRDGNSKAEDTWTIRRRKRGDRKEVHEKMPKLDNVGGTCVVQVQAGRSPEPSHCS